MTPSSRTVTVELESLPSGDGLTALRSSPVLLDRISWSFLDDPALDEGFGKPMALRSRESSKAVRVVPAAQAGHIQQPREIGTYIVQAARDLGQPVEILSTVPGRKGFRQAFILPGLLRSDSIKWDRTLFSSDVHEAVAFDGLSLVVGLFTSGMTCSLQAGWFRAYCSNQLMDGRLGLVPALRRIEDAEGVQSWLTSAMGAALLFTRGLGGLPLETEPFPAVAVDWTLSQLQREEAEQDGRIQHLVRELRDKLGSAGAQVLLEQFSHMDADELAHIDLVNAVNNLTRPRETWRGATVLGGDQALSIVSPRVVTRVQTDAVDLCLQALFLGAQASDSMTHPLLIENPYQPAGAE